jgi:phospholipid-binding lipoprotein MlaA
MPPVNSVIEPTMPRGPQASPARSKPARPRRLVLAYAVLAVTCGVPGCASLPEGSKRDPRDHLERFNRAIYKFNSALDHAVFRPVARGYVKVMSRPVRTGVSNVFSNLGYPKTIANDIFQGHPVDFGSDIARLVVNTTVGAGGVFDPATRLGLEKHDRDFGQTLGKWGLPTGTYLMLPLLGSSDLRDAVGTVPDRFMSVEGQISDPVLQGGLTVSDKTNARANLLPLDKIIDKAYDPYAFERSVWFQKRAYKVRGDSQPTVILEDSDRLAPGVRTDSAEGM